MMDLEFENHDGSLGFDACDDEIQVVCQTKGSYDYGTYWLTKSEAEKIIKYLQKWCTPSQKTNSKR